MISLWIEYTTTHWFTRSVSKPYCRNTVCLLALLNGCNTVICYYGFKWSSFVAMCTDDFETPVSWDNCFKDIFGHASKRAPMSSSVSSERTRRVLFRFLSITEPVVRNFATRRCIVDFEGTETPGNRARNLLRHFLYDLFFIYVSTINTLCITLYFIFTYNICLCFAAPMKQDCF
jgi:hypothetical protein